MRYEIVEGDITHQNVDCIVNAWNRNPFPHWLLLPQGVSKAVRNAAGKGPFRELARMPMIPLGGAVLTGPGNSHFKAIIHVAGINLLWFATRKSICESVRNAVELAEKSGFKSLALPLIGSGSGNRKREKSLEIIRETLDAMESPVEVRVVIYQA